MPRATRFLIFLGLSLIFIIASGILLVGEVNRYNAALALFPQGTVIAGIPVGGLNNQGAEDRLSQAFFQTPVELQFDGVRVQIDPEAAGLQIDLPGMVQAAQQALAQRAYWPGFWDFLMNRPPSGVESSLNCTVAVDHLRQYLNDTVGSLYDHPAASARPAALAEVTFQPGSDGRTLDLIGAEPAIRAALCNRTERVVDVAMQSATAAPPSIADLNLLMQSLVQVSAFPGITEVYFQDLTSGQEFNFAMNGGKPVEPGIAFTAASTIKIPVMVSTYKKIDGAMPESLRRQMELMIDLSDNGSTDEVMQQALDTNIAPILVSQDMQALGLNNTFLAGFFYPGAPLLNLYQTPANQRTDLTTEPDVYNQTTAADMGRLLAAIQHCAENKGPLIQVFGGKVTPEECQEMTGYLEKNRKGVLIEAGLPDGGRLAHKYGWVTDPVDGLMHNTSDASIVYSAGGNFILTIYLYDRDQLQWDQAQRLAARLATAGYNFYNHWQ